MPWRYQDQSARSTNTITAQITINKATWGRRRRKSMPAIKSNTMARSRNQANAVIDLIIGVEAFPIIFIVARRTSRNFCTVSFLIEKHLSRGRLYGGNGIAGEKKRRRKQVPAAVMCSR